LLFSCAGAATIIDNNMPATAIDRMPRWLSMVSS
jgi:hypothetical protein